MTGPAGAHTPHSPEPPIQTIRHLTGNCSLSCHSRALWVPPASPDMSAPAGLYFRRQGAPKPGTTPFSQKRCRSGPLPGHQSPGPATGFGAFPSNTRPLKSQPFEFLSSPAPHAPLCAPGPSPPQQCFTQAPGSGTSRLLPASPVRTAPLARELPPALGPTGLWPRSPGGQAPTA